MIGASMLGRKSMKGSALLVLTALAALASCTSKPDPSPPEPPSGAPREEAATQSEKPPTRERIIDPQGRLIPSDEYIVGIRLPRGTELIREDGLLHVYRVRAPIDKVLAYFGPMMITGNVERRGTGAIYKQASVRGAEVNPTKVDVSIVELGTHSTRVAVTELPPPPKHKPSSDQTKAAAKESFRMLD
jgi:hypothetical protein